MLRQALRRAAHQRLQGRRRAAARKGGNCATALEGCSVICHFYFVICHLPEAVFWVRGRQGVFRLTFRVNQLYITAYKLGKIANFLISATTGGPFGSYRGY
jgi:hypothetical protein